jgi:chromate transporter
MAVLLVIVTLLSLVYDRFASLPEVNAALVGAAAGAAGLVMGTGLKMARKIRPAPLPLLVTAAAFVAVGLLQWPLVPVVIVVAPLRIAVAKQGQRQ